MRGALWASTLTGLAVFGFLALGRGVWLPADAAVADETFYLLQARFLRAGEWRWFDATSSLTWAFALAPVSPSLGAARLASCLAAGLAALWGSSLLRPSLGGAVGPLAAALVVTQASVAPVLAAAYSDAWGALLLVAWLTHHLRRGEGAATARQLVSGGLLLGLALASRLSFLTLVPALVLGLAAIPSGVPWRPRWRALALEVGAGVLLAVVAQALVGNALVADKGGAPTLAELLHRLRAVPGYTGWPLLVFGAAGLVALSRELPAWRAAPGVALLALGGALPNRMWQERYLFPLLVLLAVGAAFLVVHWLSSARGAAAAVLALVALDAVPRLPARFCQGCNVYRLAVEDCTVVSTMQSSCLGASVALPFLEQARETTCTYRAALALPRGASHLFASYLDDQAVLRVDGREVGRAHAFAPARLPLVLAAGTHTLELAVTNDVAFGGVGQLMVCGRGPAGGDEVVKVQHAFRAILGREADLGGLEAYARQLRGGLTAEALCQALVTSEEFAARRRALTSGQLVDSLYRGLLERAPDEAGRAAALQAVEAGRAATFAGGLLDSEEFRQRFLAPGP